MPLNLKSALGVHPEALVLRAQRSSVLASNMANADTPNYKARDIDFQAMLKAQVGKLEGMQVRSTHANHINMNSSAGSISEPLYRAPLHASLDGNTVDAEMESVRFAENAMRYEASLMFLSRKISGIKGALRGD